MSTRRCQLTGWKAPGPGLLPGGTGRGQTLPAGVTAAITFERLAPAGERIARIIGGVGVGAGILLMMRAEIIEITAPIRQGRVTP